MTTTDPVETTTTVVVTTDPPVSTLPNTGADSGGTAGLALALTGIGLLDLD